MQAVARLQSAVPLWCAVQQDGVCLRHSAATALQMRTTALRAAGTTVRAPLLLQLPSAVTAAVAVRALLLRLPLPSA